MTVRLVPPRAAALRLLALYAYAGLCSGPAAVILLLGPRGAEAWADPARLSPGAQGAVLGLAAASLAACVALALRSLLLHPLELLLPRLRAVPVALAAAATALAVRFGGLHGGSALARGVAGALWAGHGHHLALLVGLAVVVLPALQAAFFFGLLQTRLEECLPLWAALVLPAAAFALSGPVTGVPMPALPAALLLGLLLAWTRREAGAAGSAAALAAGTAVAMALALVVR